MDTPGGIHDMLTVRVRAAHGWVFGPKFSEIKKGLFPCRFSLNMGGFGRKFAKIIENGQVSIEIRHKSGSKGK